MTEPLNPYHDGVCWYGIKVSMREPGNHQRGTVKPCGLDASKYTVQRQHSDGPTLTLMTVWVCANHKTSLENDGFLLTLEP